MNRISLVQDYVDQLIDSTCDEVFLKSAYMHLYGVAQNCALLAMKRGQNVELAVIAGLLHDIYTYETKNAYNHAYKGSLRARTILRGMGVFSVEEIEVVAHAIYYHSDKQTVHAPMDEILKDADVLNHCLYNPLADVSAHEVERFERIKKELDIQN